MDHAVCAGNIRDRDTSTAKKNCSTFFGYLNCDTKSRFREIQSLDNRARQVAKENMVLDTLVSLP